MPGGRYGGMRWIRIIALCLVASLGLGCFVFNELDSGSKEMDRYAGHDKTHHAAPAPPTATQANPQAASNSPASDWWRKAHTLSSEKVDPDIVPCRLHGQVQFMRKNDCAMRGGTAG